VGDLTLPLGGAIYGAHPGNFDLSKLSVSNTQALAQPMQTKTPRKTQNCRGASHFVEGSKPRETERHVMADWEPRRARLATEIQVTWCPTKKRPGACR